MPILSGALRRVEMTELNTHTEPNSASEPEKFYLPAVTSPPSFDRIEAVVTDLPDTYNN